MNNEDHKYRGIPGKVWERVFDEISSDGLGATIRYSLGERALALASEMAPLSYAPDGLEPGAYDAHEDLRAMAGGMEIEIAELKEQLQELRDQNERARQAPTWLSGFASKTAKWLIDCFGTRVARDTAEREHRFLEEAVELVQAGSTTAEQAHQIVDYVYSRPTGEREQEVGGVMVTLAALCFAHSISLSDAAVTELLRVQSPQIMAKIRQKQATKPAFSPLPGTSYPDRKLWGPESTGDGSWSPGQAVVNSWKPEDQQ